MNHLKQVIEENAEILSNSILKVDRFLNHQIDIDLMEEIGEDFADYFKRDAITKVITVESGGILPAYTTARRLHVPLVFAKKTEPSTMRSPLLADVYSFTKCTCSSICVEGGLIERGDRLLFIDDFLANGQAFLGVCHLAEQAGAEVVAAGFCIEKSWQRGHSIVSNRHCDIHVLASIASLKDKKITWNEDEESGADNARPEEAGQSEEA